MEIHEPFGWGNSYGLGERDARLLFDWMKVNGHRPCDGKTCDARACWCPSTDAVEMLEIWQKENPQGLPTCLRELKKLPIPKEAQNSLVGWSKWQSELDKRSQSRMFPSTSSILQKETTTEPTPSCSGARSCSRSRSPLRFTMCYRCKRDTWLFCAWCKDIVY